MNNVFCCERFHQDVSVNRKARPNIRIVKIDRKIVPQINPIYPYLFIITIGYDETDKNIPLRMIDYCPYCGESLKDFYRSDDYINETNHSFMMF